jgi:hypothetical protein
MDPSQLVDAIKNRLDLHGGLVTLDLLTCRENFWVLMLRMLV